MHARKRIIISIVASITFAMISLILTVQHINEMNQRNDRIEAALNESSYRHMHGARTTLEEYMLYFEILSSGRFAEKEASFNRDRISFEDLTVYGEYERHTVIGYDQWHKLEWLSMDEIEAIVKLSHAEFPSTGNYPYNFISVEGPSLVVTFGHGGFLASRLSIERNETLEEETSLTTQSSIGTGRPRQIHIHRQQIEGAYYLRLTLHEQREPPNGLFGLRIFLLVLAGIFCFVALYNYFENKNEKKELRKNQEVQIIVQTIHDLFSDSQEEPFQAEVVEFEPKGNEKW